jgi:hypothetical protein
MSKRNVQFTETVKLGTTCYEDGDVASFPKAEADQYIALGWCKCMETGEQGERKPGAAPLDIDSIKQPA